MLVKFLKWMDNNVLQVEVISSEDNLDDLKQGEVIIIDPFVNSKTFNISDSNNYRLINPCWEGNCVLMSDIEPII